MDQIPILKIPLTFYGLSVDPAIPRDREELSRLSGYVDRLTKELKAQIVQTKANPNATLSEDLYRAIKTMPAAVFRLPDDYEVPVSLFSILHEHIYYVYNAFKANPDQNLEALLTGYPEYIYYILTDPKETENSLKSQPEAAVRQMFGNPCWVIKWMQSNPPNVKPQDLMRTHQELLRSIYNLHDHDACSAHTFHWLKTRNATPDVKLEEAVKLLSALGSSPYIAIITAIEYPQIDVEPLLVEIKRYPMWCYNWLRLVGNQRGPVHELIQKLIEWVPWGIQYLHDVKPADGTELLEQIKRVHNPWWDEWLDRYLDKHEKKRT